MDRNVDRAAIVRFDEASIANEAEHFRQLRARTFEERFGQSQLASLAEGTSGESFGRSGADFGVDQAFRPAAAEQAGTSRESFGRREGDFGVDQEGFGPAEQASIRAGKPEAIGSGCAIETSRSPPKTSDLCAEWARRSAAAECFGTGPNETGTEVINIFY